MNDSMRKCKWVLALVFLSGCVHQMELSKQSMKRIDALAVKKTFWLKQSLYAGQFYDDERFDLVHPRSFNELTYVQMPDGANVLPPNATEIIPVGTKVSISQIEWPDLKTYLNRPLFTPRAYPWMKMKIAMDRGDVSMMRAKTYIFVLPVGHDNDAQFESWFASIFSVEDTNRWLLYLKDNVKEGVLNKKAVIGMSLEAMFAALGEPNSLSTEKADDNGISFEKTIANYDKQVILLKNGVVKNIQVLTPSTPAQFQSASGNVGG